MKVFAAVIVLSVISVVSIVEAVSSSDVARTLVKVPGKLDSPDRGVDEQQLHQERNENRLATDGYLAFPRQFPYYAKVQIQPKSLNYFHSCAGTLITPNYILTTATCLYPWTSGDDIEYAFVTLGSLFDGNTQWEQRINFTANGITTHPLYRYLILDLYDIGTILLDYSATLNQYVEPIRLPRLSDTRMYDMMEGTSTGAAFVGGLKYLRNQVMSNAACQQDAPTRPISAQHICTDSYIGGAFCNREYGSPLTVEDASGRVLVGFTGFTMAVCSSNYPIFHVRVSYFRDWIQLNTDYVFDF